MQTLTIKARLVASDSDGMGYTNYVFENLNFTGIDDQFILCVRFPNWNHANVNILDEGYVTVRFVEAGIDQWYDGREFNTYNYTNCIFMKFIEDKPPLNINNIILD